MVLASADSNFGFRQQEELDGICFSPIDILSFFACSIGELP
jgi:hypothetical protein